MSSILDDKLMEIAEKPRNDVLDEANAAIIAERDELLGGCSPRYLDGMRAAAAIVRSLKRTPEEAKAACDRLNLVEVLRMIRNPLLEHVNKYSSACEIDAAIDTLIAEAKEQTDDA